MNETSLTLEDNVLLEDGAKCKLVQLQDVRYFETCGNYSKCYFNGGMLLINRSLNYLENRLSNQTFFRANRQFIINLYHVTDVNLISNSKYRIIMSCGKEIFISRRRSQYFREALSI